jgi:hypothetical protein
MPSCPSRRPPAHSSHRARLEALAHLLATDDGDELGDAAPPDLPLAAGVSDPPDDPHGGCLHLQALVGDPVDAMVGFVAPPEWWAFGVVVPVTLHDLDGRGELRGSRPGRRLVHLVSRHGATFAVAAGPGGIDLVKGPRPSALEGRIPDACRRVLGLATAPPTVGTGAFFVTRWLDGALERAIAGHSGDDGNRLGDEFDHDAVVAATVDFERHWSWERLRRACAAGEALVEGMTSEEAAWWDEGGFSRRAFEGYLAAGAMLDLLDELGHPAATGRLRPDDDPANPG